LKKLVTVKYTQTYLAAAQAYKVFIFIHQYMTGYKVNGDIYSLSKENLTKKEKEYS